MVSITFDTGDTTVEVDADVGASAMQAAVRHGVPGIVAECGGAANCATCHVYVQDLGSFDLGEVGPIEDEMLMETACPRQSNSRLSCQIIVTTDLEGLRLTVPERQY